MNEHFYMYIKKVLILFTVEVGVAETRTPQVSENVYMYNYTTVILRGHPSHMRVTSH